MMAVSRRLRYEILRRDDHTCRYCGAKAPDVPLTVDHVLPVALGGGDEPENLVTACKDCNAGKTSIAPDSPLVANVNDDAIRWAKALEAAAVQQAERRDYRRQYIEETNASWERWKAGDGEHLERPTNWRESIERFHDLGLEWTVLDEAIDTAMRANIRTYNLPQWRYFCGICWRVIRERQEIAGGILATGDDEL